MNEQSDIMDTKLFEKLLNAFGVSGREAEVRQIIEKELNPYVDKITVDKMGNLIAMKKGSAPRVMLAAHMDEIGLMVKSIDERGKIFCTSIGGVEAPSLIGNRVKIRGIKKLIRGVITTEVINDGQELQILPKMDDLIVDAGLNKSQLNRLGVRVGSYIFLEEEVKTLGSKDCIIGKSLDDRVGCYILIELAKKLKKVKNETYFVFTVQEEVGLYGAKTSAWKVEPDWAIAVDVTNADDFRKNPTKFLGKGPCITIKDADMIGNPCINDWLQEIAKKKKIPVQYEVSETGTTDALTISLTKGGIPSSVLVIPIRNIHTSYSIVHRKDIENAIKLLYSLLSKPPKVCVT